MSRDKLKAANRKAMLEAAEENMSCVVAGASLSTLTTRYDRIIIEQRLLITQQSVDASASRNEFTMLTAMKTIMEDADFEAELKALVASTKDGRKTLAEKVARLEAEAMNVKDQIKKAEDQQALLNMKKAKAATVKAEKKDTKKEKPKPKGIFEGATTTPAAKPQPATAAGTKRKRQDKVDSDDESSDDEDDREDGGTGATKTSGDTNSSK